MLDKGHAMTNKLYENSASSAFEKSLPFLTVTLIIIDITKKKLTIAQNAVSNALDMVDKLLQKAW